MPAGRERARFLPLVALLASGVPSAAPAQIRASEMGAVWQIIDGTRIAVEYSRPRARGRSDMFGGEIKWQEVWTPGANDATTLELSRDVKIEGHPIPKGKYSVWMVVRPDGNWTFVLDPRHKLFHMAHVDSTAEQIRFPVKTEKAPFTEVLTWAFPENSSVGTTLDMRWGTVRVPLRIAVQPTYRIGMARAEALPYLGEWELRWTDMPDSAKSMTLTVAWQDSMMVMRQVPKDDYMENASLIRIKSDWFIPGIFRKGELLDAIGEMVYEFKVVEGKAVSFEIRGNGDELWARGKRR